MAIPMQPPAPQPQASGMYQNPEAANEVLMGRQPSPEETEIASRIMNEGLSNALGNMDAPQGAPQMQQVSGGPSIETESAPWAANEARSEWLLRNADEPVPFDPNMTWAEYISKISEAQGPEAANAIIDERIQSEEGPPRITPEDMERAIPGASPAPAPVPTLPTTPIPEGEALGGDAGIMAAAKGGLVGFNLGGLNQAPAGAPVDESEFMGILSQISEEAGVPEGALDQVAEVAMDTTGGPAAANDNALLDSGIMQNVEAVDATEGEMTGIGSLTEVNDQLAAAGEEQLVHVSPGEMIFDPSRLNEPDQRMLLAALETAGINPDMATVGNEANILNQMTGLPAFGFFSGIKKIFKKAKKVVKKVGKFLKKNAGTILGIAGAMTGNPLLAALGSGIGSLIEGKPIQQALLSAGMSFAGTKWVGPWIGKQLSSVSGTFTQPVGTALQDAGIQAGSGTFAAGTGKLAAEKAATEAAYGALFDPATQALGQQAAGEVASNAATEAIKTALGNTVTETVAAEAGNTIAREAVNNVISGTVTNALAGPVSTNVLTSVPERFLTQSVGNLAGKAVAGVGQMVAQPIVEQYMGYGGVPGEDEAAAREEFLKQYNYEPSAGELYEFYASQFLPNQQVNIAGTLGDQPGYTGIAGALPQATGTQVIPNVSPVVTAATTPAPQITAEQILAAIQQNSGIIGAAGGGYINGIGGPKSDSNLARLSDGEFVMTEAAVRGAGGGNRMLGAKRMYDTMNGLERRVA
jgi:hypothetical protein